MFYNILAMNEPLPGQTTASSPAARAAEQETDVWWGAYSAWTLLPSTAVCIVLTAAFAWAAWSFLHPPQAHLAFWSVCAALWIGQGAMCWRHVFGYSYRLTTRRLLVMHGHFWWKRYQVNLAEIEEVRIKRDRIARWLDLGTLVIGTRDGARLAVDGVRRAHEVAERIRRTRDRGMKKV